MSEEKQPEKKPVAFKQGKDQGLATAFEAMDGANIIILLARDEKDPTKYFLMHLGDNINQGDMALAILRMEEFLGFLKDGLLSTKTITGGKMEAGQ